MTPVKMRASDPAEVLRRKDEFGSHRAGFGASWSASEDPLHRCGRARADALLGVVRVFLDGEDSKRWHSFREPRSWAHFRRLTFFEAGVGRATESTFCYVRGRRGFSTSD